MGDDGGVGGSGLQAAMSGGPIAAILFGWVVASFVLGLALRGPIQRRWLGGTGIMEWRVTATHLSWRQRWRLYWATIRGRAVTPGLAGLAVQRGQMALAVSERMSMSRGPYRWLWRVAVALMSASALFNLALAVFDRSDSPDLWSILSNASLLVVLIVVPLVERRQRRAMLRCVDLNRDQLDRDVTGRP